MKKTILLSLSCLQGTPRSKGKLTPKTAVLFFLLFVFAALAYSQGGANEWTWIGGSSQLTGCGNDFCYPYGVYGTLGTPAVGNIPSGRGGASSWASKDGKLWLFGGQGRASNGAIGDLNDMWEFNPSTSEWAWMGGSSTAICYPQGGCGQPGVYGTLKTPAGGNAPGGRFGASSWTDSSGHFWLFGGIGYDANGNGGYLNDLWEFDPSTNEWAWMGGSSTMICDANGEPACGQPGAYGTLKTPVAGNAPGGREGASSWIDSKGRFWLFGGMGFDAESNLGYLNDLWEFNPSTNQWAWMGGSSTMNCGTSGCGQAGVYGSPGSPVAENIPGGRHEAMYWTDGSGNLWLFGGEGYDASGAWGELNDLWEFSPSANYWTWVSGSSTLPGTLHGRVGVYGTLGESATGNSPGSRNKAISWTDDAGHLWLFGGNGYDANGDLGFLNDLWEFNPSTSEWAWMSGSNITTCISDSYAEPECGQSGVYGSQGTPASANIPGGRFSASTWIDGDDNLWLFGGEGLDSGSGTGNLNDLWKYQPTYSVLTATVASGSTASYPLNLPSDVINVSVTCQNLPAGASCSYSANTNALTITTSSTTPAGKYQVTVTLTETIPGAATAAILLPIPLLPLVFLRNKLAARGLWFAVCLGMVLLAATAFNVGCGGGGSNATITPTPQTHQVTSSGIVNLTVQ